MPSDKHNSLMAKARGLVLSLFNVALAQEVPFGIPQYVQCILHGFTSDCTSYLYTYVLCLCFIDAFLSTDSDVCTYFSLK